MSRLRLLLISEYFWPDQASTGRLLGELIAGLKKEHPEWEIDVLTSTRVYRGGRGQPLPHCESWHGIHIRRLRSFRSGQDSLWRRALSDVLFSLRVGLRVLASRYDVVLVVTNPPLMPMVVSMISTLRRRRMVYLIHDLYPDVPITLGLWPKSSLQAKLLRKAQSLALQRAARIIVLGESMRDYLVRTYEATADKIAVIPNWATTKVQKPDVASSDHFNRFNVVYSGNLGQLHDFDTILDAAELLHGNPSVRFLIVGDGARAEWLRQEVGRRNLPNVVMKPFLPDPEFAELLGEASLGVISLEPGMEPLGVPSKMYNFLAAGVPLLAISGPDSEVARIIGERQIGYLVAHGDARSFASSVLDAYQNRQRWLEMSKNARAYAYAEARLDVAARRYAEELLRARLSASAHRSK